MAIPIFKELSGSGFANSLKEIGFTECYCLSSEEPNAFYKLLATGLIGHFNSSYPVSDRLRNLWSRNARVLWDTYFRYEQCGTEKFLSPGYWNELGTAMMRDITEEGHFPSGKPFLATVRAGKEIDKTQTGQYEAILGLFCASLVWYEQRSDGTNMTNKFITANSNNPQVYICIAQEGTVYYLLYHKDFSLEKQREGFPFYTFTPNDARLPSIGESSVSQASGPQQNVQECIDALLDFSQQLGLLLTTLVPQIPVTYSGYQQELKVRRDKAVAILRASGYDTKWLSSAELDHMLQIAETQPEAEVPQYHDATNCSSFPDTPLDVAHNEHHFHSFCLRTYIGTPSSLNAVIKCPVCNEQLPEPILAKVIPEFVQLKKESKGATLRSLSMHPGQGVSAAPQASVAPQAFAAPQASAAPQVFVAPQAFAAPQASAAPQVFVAPQAFAAPQASAAPQVFVAPQAFAAPQASAAPQVFVAPQAFAAPPAYETPVVPYRQSQCGFCYNPVVQDRGVQLECGGFVCQLCISSIKLYEPCRFCSRPISTTERNAISAIFARTIAPPS